MRLRIGKALLYGSGLSVGGGLGYSLYQADGDVSNIGAVRYCGYCYVVLVVVVVIESFLRFGRAAVAVGKIAVDYKKTLYSSVYPDDTSYEAAKSECHLRAANHLLHLCSVNGGVFVKVGQHIGALDYLLPEEYVNTMKVLHNRSPQMPLEDIYSVLREELGKEVTIKIMMSSS